jgi:hypothetical protein
MWTNAGKITRGYTDYKNMREIIFRISKMTHMDKRSLTNDEKIVYKIHKLAGDYHTAILEEEKFLGSVPAENNYTDYTNMKKMISKCHELTHEYMRLCVNDSIVINKVHQLTTNYFRLLNHEEREIGIEKYYAEQKKG